MATVVSSALPAWAEDPPAEAGAYSAANDDSLISPDTPDELRARPEGAAEATTAAEWFPLRGSSIRIGCTWGPTSCGGYHSYPAIDIYTAPNTPVYASGGGTAYTMGGCVAHPPVGNSCNQGAGNYVRIDHGSHSSRYFHLASFAVGNGASVERGQLIGFSGASGNTQSSSGGSFEHLHYEEINTAGGRIDPGTLYACHGGSRVSYPSAAGAASWSSLGTHSVYVRNDGLGCDTAPPVDDSTQLLPSGSFENGGGDWRSNLGANLVRYQNTPTRRQAHDGSYFIATNSPRASASISRDIGVNLAPGAGVTASTWVRSQESSASGTWCVWALTSPTQSSCTNYTATSKWKRIEVVLNPLQATNTIRIELYPTPTTGGTTFLDTITVTRGTLLPSGSFENGGGDWRSNLGANLVRYQNTPTRRQAHDGSYFIATNSPRASASISRDIGVNLAPGAGVTASTWVRSQESSASGTWCVWALTSPTQSSCTNYTATSKWKRIEVVLNPLQATNTIRIELYPTPTTGGTTFLDTITVTR